MMNNFYINISAVSFTNIQKDLQGNVNSNEIKRLKRYENEIEARKEDWKEHTVSAFNSMSEKYEN